MKYPKKILVEKSWVHEVYSAEEEAAFMLRVRDSVKAPVRVRFTALEYPKGEYEVYEGRGN